METIFTKCIICSKKLARNYTGRKFCSRNCYYLWHKKNPNKGQFIKGHTKGFQIGHKFCGEVSTQFKKGQKVWNEGLKGLQPWHNISGLNTGTSWMKGKHIKTNDALDKWRENGGKSPTGKKHWNWKGGKSKLRERIENLPKYRKWQMDCFQKANGRCEDCGGKLKLIVHHKKLFSEILDDNKITTITQAKDCKELWDTKNGKVLCQKPCHKKYHSFL